MKLHHWLMRRLTLGLAYTTVAMLVAGCSVQTSPPPATLVPLTPGGEAKLIRQLDLPLQSNYGIAAPPPRIGTTWKNVSSIDQGQLYKSVDGVLTVTDGGFFSGTSSESDLVVDQGKIVGVYLLQEKKFVAAAKPVSNCLTGISQ